ncbi:hypothetical protein C8R44DRAFT_753136 [Mycena epipterygia]|nr:hypothetical protein C8R44DRAFT_753136 [Mycena epipterygia]
MADPAEDAPTTSSLTAKCIGSHCDGVDITNPFFRDLLVDRPIPGANAIGSLADCRSGPSRAPKTRKKRLVTLRGQGRIINRALIKRLTTFAACRPSQSVLSGTITPLQVPRPTYIGLAPSSSVVDLLLQQECPLRGHDRTLETSANPDFGCSWL